MQKNLNISLNAFLPLKNVPKERGKLPKIGLEMPKIAQKRLKLAQLVKNSSITLSVFFISGHEVFNLKTS